MFVLFFSSNIFLFAFRERTTSEKIDWLYSKTCETFLTIELIYFIIFFFIPKKFFSSFLLVIYRELRLRAQERMDERVERRKAQNQNGKLMATRSNNTKLSFRLIGQLKKRSDFNCSKTKWQWKQQQQKKANLYTFRLYKSTTINNIKIASWAFFLRVFL